MKGMPAIYFPSKILADSLCFRILVPLRGILDIDRLVCSDAKKLENFISPDSIDLSIIAPPYHKLDTNPSKHIDLIKNVLKKITKVTKIGGICCLIIS